MSSEPPLGDIGHSKIILSIRGTFVFFVFLTLGIGRPGTCGRISFLLGSVSAVCLVLPFLIKVS